VFEHRHGVDIFHREAANEKAAENMVTEFLGNLWEPEHGDEMRAFPADIPPKYAAAPELLEACQSALVFFTEPQNMTPAGSTFLLKRLRAAIAKAEGK
jgi:hypothetical protein